MKRKLLILTVAILLFLLLSTAFVISAQESDNPATQLTLTMERSGILRNRNYRTSVSLDAGEFNINADGYISYLYIIHQITAPNFQIKNGDEIIDAGQYGILQELIRLDGSQTEIILLVPDDGMQLIGIHAFTQGDLPYWVRDWQPPYTNADILLLPTHADDEMLFFGALMMYYGRERGLRVQIAYKTHHGGYYNNSPFRMHEALNGLWESGITAHPVWGYFEDIWSENLRQALRQYDIEEVTRFVVECIRRFKPQVVVGHDIDGEYGHGGHMLFAYALQQAVKVSGDADYFSESAEEYGVWVPHRTFLNLFPFYEQDFSWDTDYKVLYDWYEMVLDSFDGATGIEVAWRAFEHHVSQQGAAYFMQPATLLGLYQYEIGFDSAGDANSIFAGLMSWSVQETEDDNESRNSVMIIIIVVVVGLMIVTGTIIYLLMKKKSKRQS